MKEEQSQMYVLNMLLVCLEPSPQSGNLCPSATLTRTQYGACASISLAYHAILVPADASLAWGTCPLLGDAHPCYLLVALCANDPVALRTTGYSTVGGVPQGSAGGGVPKGTAR